MSRPFACESGSFFCHNPICPQRIFSETFPNCAARYARRTKRLDALLLELGIQEGGEGGSNLGRKLGYHWSPDTLLRIIKNAEVPDHPTPIIIGVDDFAFRKCHTYGTIIVDLLTHRPITLLPDRCQETLQTWLEKHQGIKLISRDQAGAYAKAATRGAPQAEQVADRWHLIKNVGDVLERTLNRYPQIIRQAHHLAEDKAVESSDEAKQAHCFIGPIANRAATTPAQVKRNAQHDHIHRMLKEGESIRGISRTLGLTRKTVRKYARAEQPPEHAGRGSSQTLMTPYIGYLKTRWESGIHNAAQLYRELKLQGYLGSPGTVRHFLGSWRNGQATNHRANSKSKVPSARYLSRIMTCLSTEDKASQEYLNQLYRLAPKLKTAAKLGRQFVALLRERRHDLFKQWLKLVGRSEIVELKQFARGLISDRAAVMAAMKSEWSNGQTEGQVNKLKLLKRTMYGRAGFALLQKRFLLLP